MSEKIKERFDEIFDAVSHGALDCESKQIQEDMLWLCEKLREAWYAVDSLKRAMGEIAESRLSLLREMREMNTQLSRAVLLKEEATRRNTELKKRLEVIGKGRYCPECKSWLLGLQGPGEACGTCMAKIEWRDLSELRAEWSGP